MGRGWTVGQDHGFLERLGVEFLTQHAAATLKVIAGHLGLTSAVTQAHGGPVGAFVEGIFVQQGLNNTQSLMDGSGLFKLEGSDFE